MRPRLQRTWELLPVWAALGLNAIAHGRALLAAPLALALAWAVARGWSPGYRRAVFSAAAIAGVAIGAALLFVSEPPVGPVPPAVLSPLCGGVMALAAYCALTRNNVYAWTYAGLLAALSVEVPATPALFAAVGTFALAVLACGLVAGGAARSGAAGAAAFLAFAAVLVPAAALVRSAMFQSEGLLMETVARLMNGPALPRGFGFEDTVTLQRHTSVTAGTRVLFTLRGGEVARLRTTVLEAFDGTHWALRLARHAPVELPRTREGTPLELEFSDGVDGLLPSPAGTTDVDGGHYVVSPGWVLRGFGLSGKTVRIWRTPGEALPQEPPPPPELLAVPEELARELRPMADQLLGGRSGARDQAQALEAFFRDGFEYSLDVDLSGRGSALAVLIRERRPAFCTYFASAMAALLQIRGIQARVVGGFVPWENNPLSGETVVRERDAHAWVEVYVPEERRYVPFDPTPWRSRDAALGVDREMGAVSAALSAAASAMRRGWRHFWADPLAVVRAIGTSAWFWLAVALGVAARLLWRRRAAVGARQRSAMEGGDPALDALRRRYLRALRRADVAPLQTDTDEELLAKLGAARGAATRAAAAEFIGAYAEARFRGAPVALEALEARLETFERSLEPSRGAA